MRDYLLCHCEVLCRSATQCWSEGTQAERERERDVRQRHQQATFCPPANCLLVSSLSPSRPTTNHYQSNRPWCDLGSGRATHVRQLTSVRQQPEPGGDGAVQARRSFPEPILLVSTGDAAGRMRSKVLGGHCTKMKKCRVIRA